MLLHSIKRGKTIHKIFSIENNGQIEGKCAKFSQNVSSNFHMYEIIRLDTYSNSTSGSI